MLDFVLAFFGSSLLSGQFQPFTEVLRASRREVTRKVGILLQKVTKEMKVLAALSDFLTRGNQEKEWPVLSSAKIQTSFTRLGRSSGAAGKGNKD
jgi:hypothetical protein